MKFEKRISWKDIGKRILLGVLTAFVASLIVCSVGAFLVSGGKLTEGSMHVVATFALLMGSCAGALVATAGKSDGLWFTCGAYAAAWFLLLMCMGTILYSEPLSGVGVTALVCFGAAGGVGLCKMRRSAGHGRIKHRYKLRSFVQNAQ